jgi:hypothetical protein
MAMLRECEQCKKTVPYGALLGWWTMAGPPFSGHLDFCSWECLRTFAAAHDDPEKLPGSRRRR